MTNQRFIQTPGTSQGAALVMGLVILLIISALSITSMRGSSLELRMASNAESGISAYQIVQAVSDYIAQTPVTTPVVGGAGYTYCTANEVGCSDTGLSLAAGMYTSALSSGHIGVRIVREADRGVPRGAGTSLDKFSSAAFEVRSSFDRSSDSLGHSELVEGLIVIIPKIN